MIELSSQARVVAAPDVVWRILTDFAHYEVWTKAIRVDGRAEVGLAINYTIAGRMRPKGPVRPIRFEGKVVAARPAEELVWTYGVRALMGLRFGFELRPDGAGTLVRHYIQVSGLAAYAARRNMTDLFQPIVEAVTTALARHISKKRLTDLRPSPHSRRRPK